MGSLPVYNSGFETDDFNNYATDGFSELLIDSPISTTVKIYDNNMNFIKDIRAIVQNNTDDSILKTTERQILANIGELKSGQYIQYKNDMFLISSFVDDNKIYEKGIMKFCNWLFKWQNSKGEILSRQSVVLNASQYNSGVEENKIMTLGSNQYMVYLPLDEETMKLTYDKRVFIDNNYKVPYKITRPDNVSSSYNGDGLIILIMSQDVLDVKNDRPDLGLCDYFEPNIQPSDTLNITYAGNPEISIGRYKTFSITTDLNIIWTLNLIPIQTDKVTMIITENKVKINIINDSNLVGSSFKLIATVNDINSELLIAITGGL